MREAEYTELLRKEKTENLSYIIHGKAVKMAESHIVTVL